MILNIKLPKSIKAGELIQFINEIDLWIIEHEFDPKEWSIKVFTIPTNEQTIRDITKKFAKKLVEVDYE